MHICFDLTSLSDNLSGIERYAAHISLEMIKKHSDEYTLLFKRRIHPLFQDVCTHENIHAIVLTECHKLLFNQFKLPKAMKSINADWFVFLAFPVPIFLFKRNMVETIHDITAWDYPDTMKGLMKWYFKISHRVALKKCKAIITISEFSKNRIQNRLNYPKDRIWLIYCGVDLKRFEVHKEKIGTVKEKYNLPNEYILSLSTLEPRKNLSLLIHAYEDLVIDNIQLPPLVLAGRKGWKIEELFSSIDDRVKKQIVFTGFIDDEDLPEVYGLSKLFIFPSKYEGFGMPPLEALACGTKVLSSDSSSLPEILGDTAIYFKSEDMHDLKNKIQKCCCETELSDYEIQKNINHVKKYNWSIFAEELHQHLREL